MSLSRATIAILATTSLTACQLSQEGATNSGFRTPGSNGFISGGVDRDTQSVSRSISDGAGGGYAFVGGTNDDGLAAYAGVIPGTSGGAPVPSGVATYDATFSAVQTTGISFVDFGNGTGQISGFQRTVSGDITLSADFDSGRLTGTSTGGTLVVNGQINSDDLSGSVTYLGVDGSLDGVIGSDQTVGAFHGNDENTIFAGGFQGDHR